MSLFVTPWKVGSIAMAGLLLSQAENSQAVVKTDCGTLRSITPQDIFEQFKEDFCLFRSSIDQHKNFQKNTCANWDVEFANFYQEFTKASKFHLLNDEILKVAATVSQKGFFCYILNKKVNAIQVLIADDPEC